MNTSKILSQNTGKFEEILKEIIKKFKEDENPTVGNIENILKDTISKTTSMLLEFMSCLSKDLDEKDNFECLHCRRKMKILNRNKKIMITTIFGDIVFNRDFLYCRYCHKGRGIGDTLKEINEEHKYSKGLIDLITYVGQLVPFDEGSHLIKKFMGYLNINISGTTIQCISEEIGKKVHEENMENAEDSYEKIHNVEDDEKIEGDLYILMDGSQVNTREENNKGSTWKEMKLGEIFVSKDIIKRKNGDSIITKKEYVTYLGSVNEFKKVLLNSANNAGYGKYKNTVVIGDGAHWIWNMCDEHFPDSIKILDYYHAIENVNEYAKALYPSDEIESKKWANTVLNYLKQGKEDKALEMVNEKRINKENLPNGIVNLPEYFKNNKGRVTYQKFENEGYYIGSGPIESGNKTVIQHRMKQAGMRWSIEGGQYIAALRAKYKSNKWDDVKAAI
jgi:molybdopterin converting factor small subunit